MTPKCPGCGTRLTRDISMKEWHCGSCLMIYTDEYIDQYIGLEKVDADEEMVLAEPVTGHRVWSLDIRYMRLLSMYGPWESGFLEAVCKKNLSTPHEAPHWHGRFGSCLCGINAFKLDQLPELEEVDGPTVLGIVDLGGRVHEYERGYRAQYGRLAEATILTAIPYGSRFLGYLSEKYEAPFRAMTRRAWIEEWEATYGRDRQTSTEDQDPQAGTTAPGKTALSLGAVAAVTGSGAGANQGTGLTFAGSHDLYQKVLEQQLKQLEDKIWPAAFTQEMLAPLTRFPEKTRRERFVDWLFDKRWRFMAVWMSMWTAVYLVISWWIVS